MQAVTRSALLDSAVSVLDEHLMPTRTIAVNVPPGARLLDATPSLDLILLADRERLWLHSADDLIGVDLAAVEAATRLPSGRLLVTAPTMEQQVWQGRAYESRAEHYAYLIETNGTVVDRVELDVADAGVMLVPHPHDGSILLDAGEGQDGSRIFIAREAAGRLQVQAVLNNVVAAGFDRAGERLLLTPHPSFNTGVSLVSWPSLDPLITLTAEDVGDGFDLYGCFIGDQVLLTCYEHGAVLCSSGLEPLAWVQLGDGTPECIVGVTHDAFGVDLWRDRSVSATVWRLPTGLHVDRHAGVQER